MTMPPPPYPHKYTLLYRPPSFATLPAGKLWVLLERPRVSCGFDRRTDLPLSEYPFSVIAFTEKLSAADLKAFEIKEVF